MKPLRQAFSRADKWLLSLGLAGIVVYLFLLPQIHPDAAPAYELTKEDILDRARGFAYNRGYASAGYNWDVVPVRSIRLIDTLQTQNKNQSLFRILKDPSFNKLPAYAWEVTGSKGRQQDETASEIRISLTQAGEVWQFDATSADPPDPIREVLLKTPRLSRSTTTLDSLETADLVPRFWAINARRLVNNSVDSLKFFSFDGEDAKAIAQYYIDKSLLLHYNLQADSVSQPEELEKSMVRVVYSGRELESGIAVSSSVDVSAAGVLKRINTSYSPIVEKEVVNNSDNNIEIDSGGIDETIRLIAFFLLGIFTFILFLRRLNARLIDVKGAMQDAIWGGLFATLAVGNAAGWSVYLDSPSVSIGILSALGMMLAAGSAGAFVVFIVSCATDSIARAIWPKRLVTLTLARNVRFFNTQMGLSLIRSLGLTGVFLGFTTLFMYLPGIVYKSLGKYILGSRTLSPFIDLTTTSGLFGMLICMMLLLSLGATLYSKRPSRSLIIITITVLAAILQLGPLEVYPAWLQWILSGLIGLALILALFRFDYFSCFGGYALYTILWHAAPLWLISTGGAQIDVVLVVSLILATLVIGLIGLVTRKEVEDTNQFVPTYLREMAQQERMRGELEIARQVQSSLLPRRMPSIQGVDIAAMCLPANEVGGDYFDFIPLDKNRTALVIGDVSGKGIQAGFFMTLTKGFLHAVCQNVDSPAEVLTQVNQLFCKNVPRGTFISLIYGILDIEKNTFTFARAGHDPILYNSSKLEAPIFFKPQGMAIGLTPKQTFHNAIQDETIMLNPGDLLVFYTDGVTEAVNPKMEQFGVERLAQKVESSGFKKSARQVLQEVSEHIQAFVQSAGRADDMTMIVLRIAPVQDLLSTTQTSQKSQSWLEHEI